MNQIEYVGKHLLTFSVSRHAHTNWELIYCTSGGGTLYFDEYDLPYQAGDVAVIPPLIPHKNLSEGGFTNYHINLSSPTMNLRKTPQVVSDDSNHFIRDAFSAAFYHFSTDSPNREALLSSYGNLIVCYLTGYSGSPRCSPIVEAIEYNIIHNYPDCNYELDSYLRSLSFNYDYLRKLFKKEMGITPHQYLMDLRLQNAAENLCLAAEDERIVAEVARECGFREPLYFSRMFKKKYGVAPSQYQDCRSKGATPDSESMKIRLGEPVS